MNGANQIERVLSKEIVDTEPPDVLTEGWLHKLMVIFHAPEQWPGWLLAVLAGLIAGCMGGLWQIIVHGRLAGMIVSGILLGFIGLDALLFSLLPQLEISYGPKKAQTVVLAVARTFLTLLLIVPALPLNIQQGLGLLLGTHLLGTAALLWGTAVEPFRLQANEYMVFSDRLPADLPAIRILHLTDLHIERITMRETAVLQKIQDLKPDLIVMTGDYVNLSYNRDPVTLRQIRHFLSQLSAPYGVYATLGSPPVDLRQTIVPLFEGLHIQLMRQQWATIKIDQHRHITLLGLDCTHHIPTDAARLLHLAQEAPHEHPLVLLYHSPELMPQATALGIDLYLCGHTHGGQVRVPLIGPILTSSQLGRQYVMGLYRNGRTQLYVSRGLGLEGLSAPRVRFLAPPEITLFHLQGCGTPTEEETMQQ